MYVCPGTWVPSLPLVTLQAERAERRRASYYVAAPVQRRVQHAASYERSQGSAQISRSKRSTVNLRTYPYAICA